MGRFLLHCTSCKRVQHMIFFAPIAPCGIVPDGEEEEINMNKKNIEQVRQSVANAQRAIPVVPATGYMVSTTAFGSNAAATDIIRTGS